MSDVASDERACSGSLRYGHMPDCGCIQLPHETGNVQVPCTMQRIHKPGMIREWSCVAKASCLEGEQVPRRAPEVQITRAEGWNAS